MQIKRYHELKRFFDALTKKEKDVYLACTDKRVVPLTHYSYVTAPDSVFDKIREEW